MDDLNKLSANGGNDLFGAGTWSIDGADNVLITLTGTEGKADININGVIKEAEFDSSLTDTAAAFVTDHAAAYLTMGITVTSDGAVITFATAKGHTTGIHTASITNTTTDLAGTIARTGYRLPHMVYAFNVSAEAVVDSCLIKRPGEAVETSFARFIGKTLPAGTLIVFEHPATEIEITSGDLVLNFIK